MSPDQLASCKERLPPHLAREFENLQREATALLAEAWRMRRQAWKLYRDYQRGL